MGKDKTIISDLDNDFKSDHSISAKEEMEDGSTGKSDIISATNKRKLPSTITNNKRKKGEKYKQPTAEELNTMRANQNLFSSNLFRLQIEEMLKHVEVKDRKLTAFNKWFAEFYAAIKDISEYDGISPNDFVYKRNKQKLPPVQVFVNSTSAFTKYFTVCDNNTKSCFARPEKAFTFGNFKMGACTKSDFVPNVAVTMPKSAFYEKDFLNNRYLVKRFHYLLYIYQEVKSKQCIKKIDLAFHQDNEMLPILLITPTYNPKICIQLFVVPERDFFKYSRMEPNMNNIKTNMYEGLSKSTTKSNTKYFDAMDISNFITKGTPLYNTLLLHDFTLEDNYALVENTLREYKCAQDGIKLITIWSTQRNLNNRFTSFTSELLTYCIIYLINKKKINKLMSSYQVAKVFWLFMTESDWRSKPISLSSNTDFAAFSENFDVVFTDNSGSYNLAGFLDVNVYEKVKFEAALALEILNQYNQSAFTSLFFVKMPTELQYDCILYLTDEDAFKSVFEDFTSDDIKFKYFGFYKLLIMQQLSRYLKYGLNKRVELMVPLPIGKPIDFKGQNPVNQIVFGLKLNSENAFKTLEIGPQQYDQDATQFKEFWGELAKLRRFNDSSIHEAVFFESAKTVQDKRKICEKIVDIVAKKLNVRCEIQSTEHEDVLHLPQIKLPFDSGTNEEITKKVLITSEELFKNIRDLKLENTVQMVQGISDVFCCADPYPPVANNYFCGKKMTKSEGNTLLLRNHKNTKMFPRFVPVIQCVMQLNLTNKVLDELAYYRAVCAQAYLDIAQALESHNRHIRAVVHYAHLDVLYGGLVYRLRAFSEREVALLKRTVSDTGVTAYRDCAESVRVAGWGRVLPRVYGALSGLYKQYTAFGTSTAIAKRWIRAQLIHDAHISDVVINLLNAAVFLSPEPFDSATLPQLAFLRFLRFLAEYSFDEWPVIVNFNDDMKREQLKELETKFVDNRLAYSPVHIIMPYDEGKSIFTSKSPNALILKRLSNLAKEALKLINVSVLEQTIISYETLFKPNLEGYNLIIHFHELLNTKRHINMWNDEVTVEIKEYAENVDSKFPIVEFSPVDKYVEKLEANYGEFAYFFYDPYGGNFVAVLWKPAVSEAKEFKISNVRGRKLVGDSLVIDKKSMINNIVELGNGLVKNVEYPD